MKHRISSRVDPFALGDLPLLALRRVRNEPAWTRRAAEPVLDQLVADGYLTNDGREDSPYWIRTPKGEEILNAFDSVGKVEKEDFLRRMHGVWR